MVVNGTHKAVSDLLKPLELDDLGNAYAAIALALAAKLDEAGGKDSGAIAMAAPALAKELRAVIDAILEGQADLDEFTTDLFAEVGHSAQS